MAKAYFPCAQCGASVTVIGQNRNLADRLAEYRQSQGALCPDCWKAERDEARAEASQQAAEHAAVSGLPVLQGSEKQVAWAETIRQDRIAKLAVIEAALEASREKAPAGACEVIADALAAIKAVDAAKWWIDHRDSAIFTNTRDFQIWLMGGAEYGKLSHPEQIARARHHFGGLPKRAAEAAPVPAEIIADAKAEATVRPESPKTETVAEIAIDGEAITVAFPEKRDDFWQIIKPGLRFEWAGRHWRRPIPVTAGPIQDRAAEVGHRLLAAGFIVRIYDPAIRASAVAGDFEPERTRWVQRHASGAFFIRWGKDEDFYQAARKLPRSHYDKPGVTVPAEFFEEVLDFAECHGFTLTAKAREVADQARANKEAAMVAKVAPKPRRAKVTADTAPPKLDVPESSEIADDLRDE